MLEEKENEDEHEEIEDIDPLSEIIKFLLSNS